MDRRDADRTPAKLYAVAVGAALVFTGVTGFFYEADFTSDESIRNAVFGLLDVNGWHNVVHILTGALGLLAYRAGAHVSRQYALGFGAVYLVVAIWGFAIGSGDSILGIIPVNTADNVLHLLLGVIGLLTAQAPASRARGR